MRIPRFVAVAVPSLIMVSSPQQHLQTRALRSNLYVHAISAPLIWPRSRPQQHLQIGVALDE